MSFSHSEWIGLILSGGGARAAYQAGVLSEIAQIRSEICPDLIDSPSPFKVICGTSAGAINGAALATRSDNFDTAASDLVDLWSHMKAGDIYEADSLGVARSGARWLTLFSLGWAIAKWRKLKPRSLLNSSPLKVLLDKMILWDRLPDLMRQGCVRSLAIATSSYSSGEHVTFYQSSAPILPWVRSSRVAVKAILNNDHLMASSAIPFIFPAAPINDLWYGDGSMRQTAPISPAIHLGADKVLVIGAGRMQEPSVTPGQISPVRSVGYPSIAQIAGHAMSNIFLDSLSADVERMGRVNQTLRIMTPEQRELGALRPIELLLIAPSERIDDIAARLVQVLPIPIRALLSALGVRHGSGGALASYLLFESAFTQELIALGKKDARAKQREIQSFFGWQKKDF